MPQWWAFVLFFVLLACCGYALDHIVQIRKPPK